MKKGVVVLILVLALLIVVSPGIIGKLAERSVDENLTVAAQQSGELVVTSTGFDRGWFSSEGTHRIELGDGNLRSALGASGSADAIPVLVINTRLDHGLIPITSMSREKGSLTPGLGSAVSTVAVELGDGDVIDIPGTIFSKVELDGDLDSRYLLEAGSQQTDSGVIDWLPAMIDFAADSSTGRIEFDVDAKGVTASEGNTKLSLGPVQFSGDLTPTGHGYSVGEASLTVGSVEFEGPGQNTVRVGKVNGEQETRLSGDQMLSSGSMTLERMTVPGFGDVGMNIEASAVANAEAMGRFIAAMKAGSTGSDPMQSAMTLQDDLKDLFAGGLSVDIDTLNVSLPMGLVESNINVEIPSSDRDDFEWTSLLLSTVAKVDLRVPEALVQMATSMNPQAGAVVGMGYLRRDGDYYVMDADFEKGLLQINGAPIPLPLGAF